MPSRNELRAEVVRLLEELGDDLDQYGGLVENHLDICAIHLRMILSDRRDPTPRAAAVASAEAGDAPDEAPKPVRRGRVRKPGDD